MKFALWFTSSLAFLVGMSGSAYARAVPANVAPSINGVVSPGEWDFAEVEFDTGPRAPGSSGWDLSGAKGRFAFDSTNLYGVIEAYPNTGTCPPGTDENGVFDNLNLEAYINAEGWPAAMFLDTTFGAPFNHPGANVVFGTLDPLCPGVAKKVVEFSVPLSTLVDNTGANPCPGSANCPQPYAFNPCVGDFLEYNVATSDPDAAGGFNLSLQTAGWVVAPNLTPSGYGKLDFAYDETRYVGTTGNDTNNDCTDSGQPCLTVQRAVDQAWSVCSGDTIIVGPGTYNVPSNNQIKITKNNLTVQSSAGAASTTIVTGVAFAPGLITVCGNNNTFEGFTIDITGRLASNYEEKAIRVTGDNNVVQDNTFIGVDNPGGAMAVLVAYGSPISGCSNANGVADGNQILNNTISSFSWGMIIGGTDLADGTLVQGNDSSLAYHGIYNDRATNSTIKENSVHHNEFYGITIDCRVGRTCAGTAIEGNNVYANGSGTIYSAGYDIGTGIYLSGAQGVSVVGNNIHDNIRLTGNGAAGVLIVNGSGGLVGDAALHCNSIVGNDVGVANCTAGAGGQCAVFAGWGRTSNSSVDATNNWWGCNAGANDAGGLCDTTLGANIVYDPWMALTLTATYTLDPGPPPVIGQCDTSTLTASLTDNSNQVDAACGTAFDGLSVDFATTLASVSPPSAVLINGEATSTLYPGCIPGEAQVSATLDTDPGPTTSTTVMIDPSAAWVLSRVMLRANRPGSTRSVGTVTVLGLVDDNDTAPYDLETSLLANTVTVDVHDSGGGFNTSFVLTGCQRRSATRIFCRDTANNVSASFGLLKGLSRVYRMHAKKIRLPAAETGTTLPTDPVVAILRQDNQCRLDCITDDISPPQTICRGGAAFLMCQERQ